MLLRRRVRRGAGTGLRATLYATAHGVYQAERQRQRRSTTRCSSRAGRRTSTRLVHETTDVTDLLRRRAQRASASRRRRLVHRAASASQGQASAVLRRPARFAGQLVLDVRRRHHRDGRHRRRLAGHRTGPIVVQPASTTARTTTRGWCIRDGPARLPTLPAGSRPCAADPSPPRAPAPRPWCAVIEERPPSPRCSPRPSGTTLLDFGQNLVGPAARPRRRRRPATAITLRHAEVLEDGELGTRPLRDGQATDTLHPGRRAAARTWEPELHLPRLPLRRGRRAGRATFDPAAVTAPSSSTPTCARTGWFACSDPLRRTGCTRTSCGACAATSSTCPPTARSATSDSAGPATSRSSPRPRRSCSTCAASSRPGCADLALEQAHADGGRAVRRARRAATSADARPPRGATRPPSCRLGALRALRRPRRPRPRSSRACGAGSTSVQALAGQPTTVGGRLPVRRLARPGRPAGQPRRGQGRPRPGRDRLPVPLRRPRWPGRLHCSGNEADADHYASLAEDVRPCLACEYVTPAGRILSDAQTAYALAIDVRPSPATTCGRRWADAWPSSCAVTATGSAPASSAPRS